MVTGVVVPEGVIVPLWITLSMIVASTIVVSATIELVMVFAPERFVLEILLPSIVVGPPSEVVSETLEPF